MVYPAVYGEFYRLAVFAYALYSRSSASSDKPDVSSVLQVTAATFMNILFSTRDLPSARLAARAEIIKHYLSYLSPDTQHHIEKIGDISYETKLKALAILVEALLQEIPLKSFRQACRRYGYPREVIVLALRMHRELVKIRPDSDTGDML